MQVYSDYIALNICFGPDYKYISQLGLLQATIYSSRMLQLIFHHIISFYIMN